jgi:site-specific DNA-methyltransferase (adenine-specific)
MNTLYYGDNLKILRERINDETIDLIYLDPPFNSNRNYNVLFKDEAGAEAEAQITAFEDTWHWTPQTEHAYHELITEGADNVSRMIEALRQFIGTNQMMAYLVMMAARLVELHRVLKPTGSLYLHCDPTASHYLKIILDTIFGAENFRSEIVWKRSHAHNSAKRYGPIHDTILFYSKSENYLWKDPRQPYDEEYIKTYFKFDDGDGRGLYWTGDLTGSGIRNGETGQTWRGINPTTKGRHWMYPPSKLEELDADNRIFWSKKEGSMPKLKRYLREAKGLPLQDFWADISGLSMMGSEKNERLGYPTQKPVALLERIVQASSNEGDVVLDPFCGCGTTIAAAQKLNRQWIGIDITHLSIALQKYRLKDSFNLVEKRDYKVIGEPEDLQSARQLASEDRYQFQWWALSLVKARPLGAATGSKEGKKGSDKGIDGVITFVDDNSGKAKRVFVQVKSGKVKSGDIRDLVGTVTREQGAIGVFITLEPPTRDMITEAATAGFYHSAGWNRDYPKLQIVTIEELLNGKELQIPGDLRTFKQAERIGKNDIQPGFFDA